MTDIPGLIAKDGAEGVFAAALPSGAAVAVKIDDGAQRAAERAVVAALAAVGVLDPELVTAPVLGGGERVGAIRIRPGLLP
jgi:L-asparaginase II